MAGTCPCGSRQTYADCCRPLHDNQQQAATAEQLMRARYAAFVKQHADYVFRTWHPRTRPEDVVASPMAWTGLEILSVADGSTEDTTGTVSFVAHYDTSTGAGELRETSTFERRAGRWVYVEGT